MPKKSNRFNEEVAEVIETPIEEVIEEAPVVEEPKKIFAKVSKAAKLNIRKMASTDSEIVKVADMNDVIELESLKETKGFYKTADGNYVMKEFVTVQ